MPILKKRDSVRIKNERPRGILNLRPAEAAEGLARYWPSTDLEPFVEHYWIVRWDLPEPRVAETVPVACVHMVLESGNSQVVGVMRKRFSRVLAGRGRVIGTRFRPGAFRAFVTAPVSSFTGRQLPIHDVFGKGARSLGARALRHDDDRQAIAVIEGFLRRMKPTADADMLLAGRIATRIADDRSIMRIGQLSREFAISPRGLQRLFSEFVGISPKWVIQRYRLLEATERVATGRVVDWADLALELGYADQAHFIREFKKLVGVSPAAYSRRLNEPRASK